CARRGLPGFFYAMDYW
nr:immunoglobulin heavy chain junction region [Mus musculus]NSM03823.1 immunoglobulin heavy chain junction region [Mus musculus]NSM04339.1 immunoglobulin heavy chain junction region [Mus musculus]NSM06588.1 immunoglobulin heavy chain junction region [Mus musculus]NSM06919.1 immunoglobulin heavy chain junction region [Mus musculus]